MHFTNLMSRFNATPYMTSKSFTLEFFLLKNNTTKDNKNVCLIPIVCDYT